MTQREARIIDVEQSGAGRLVVVNPDNELPGGGVGGGGGEGELVPPPFIGFTLEAATVYDTQSAYTVRVVLTDDEGNPRSHVVPITVTLTVETSTAQQGTHWNSGSLVATAQSGSSEVEYLFSITSDSLDPGDSPVVLNLSVAAVEQDPQPGFESEEVQSLETRTGDFALTIENDTASDPTTLQFSPTRIIATGQDFEDQTLVVRSSRPAGAGGITATLSLVDQAGQVEFNRRVSVNTAIEIEEGDTEAYVPLRGLSDGPNVLDDQDVFNYPATLTDLSGDTELAETNSQVLFVWSQIPSTARRLGWRTLTSEAREQPGDIVRLFVDQSEQPVDPNLTARFTVLATGDALIGTDYTLSPEPATVIELSGSQTFVPVILTPLANQVQNDEDRSIVLTITPLPNSYENGVVTGTEPSALVHTCTLLADDAPESFTVGFRELGHTWRTSSNSTYDIAFEISQPQPNAVDVEFEFRSPDGLTRTDIGLSASGNTFRLPAFQTTAFFTVSAAAAATASTAIARLVITDVMTTGGTVGDSDTFTVVRIGDPDTGQPEVPPLQNTVNEFKIYKNRVEFGSLTYPCPTGEWGELSASGVRTQPFDLPDLCAKYYEVWKGRNTGGVAKFTRGQQVITRIMENSVEFDQALVLNIGRSTSTSGMEWFEGNVAQPVRDLVFYSTGTGTGRKQIGQVNVYGSSTMPYVDNLMLRQLRLAAWKWSISGFATKYNLFTVLNNPGHAEHHGHVYVDGVAFEDRLFAYNRTSAPTTGFFGDSYTNVNYCVYIEAPASFVAVKDTNRSLQSGRANKGVTCFNANGYCYINGWVGSRELGRPVASSSMSGSMTQGYVAVLNVSQPANGAIARTVDVEHVFGVLDIINLTSNSPSTQQSITVGPPSTSVGSVASVGSVRAFQRPAGQASAPWYSFKEVRIGGTGSSECAINKPGGGALLYPAVTLSRIEDLSIGAFDLAGSIDSAVLFFNKIYATFGDNYRDMFGNPIAPSAVGSEMFNKPGGTTFDSANGGPTNGSLLSYAGIVGSPRGYEHKLIDTFGTKVFSDPPATNSYDGSDPS